MAALPPGLTKSLFPLIALATAITAVVVLFLWREQAGYKPVFGAREKVAVSDMMSVLEAERIPYRIHPDTGQVLVPDSVLGKARMVLAAKGVVGKLPAGLELMDRNDPLGVSQFVQDVRFRRGLEGDLTQSVLAIDAVESARVHLSIAKSSSFVVSTGEKSSASVVVSLKPGRQLSNEQIASIVNLVAGSVASLDPTRVSLVDQAGNLLSARIDLAEGFDGLQGNEAARRYQEEARRNVRDLLAHAIGEHNYQVSVTAEVDNDRVTETREIYGSTPRVTNEALREEIDRDRIALGVPGSLSNRPVNVATNAEGNEPNTAQKSATTRQYSYDRNVTQIKRSRGRLSRLNVAVVLNNAAAPAGSAGWSEAELARVERILASGLGIDAERGDKLVVSTMTFPPKAAPVPWWEQRDNIIEMVTWALYALGALLAYLLLLRPVLRLAQQRLTPAPVPVEHVEPEPLLTAPPAATPLYAPQPEPRLGSVGAVPLIDSYQLPAPGSPVDVMIDHLKVLAEKEPERVAEVVKQWVQKNA